MSHSLSKFGGIGLGFRVWVWGLGLRDPKPGPGYPANSKQSDTQNNLEAQSLVSGFKDHRVWQTGYYDDAGNTPCEGKGHWREAELIKRTRSPGK